MNSNRLAKMYDKLTPAERLCLLQAATARGDEVEENRLMRTASIITRHLLDYQPLQNAQRTLKLTAVLVLLDIAVDFWTACASASHLTDEAGDGVAAELKDRVQCLRADGTVRYHAYRLVVNLDAWKQFCLERTIEPLVGLQVLPGWTNVAQAEPVARPLAFTYEAACEFVRLTAALDGREPWDVEDLSGVVKNLHTLLDTLVEFEGGK
jgi:hypothetical protein